MKKIDFNDIPGNEHVKRAIEVAYCGGFSLRIIGSLESDYKMFLNLCHGIDDRLLIIFGAMPCPCGNYLEPDKECLCEADDVAKHQVNLSMTWYDMEVVVTRPGPQKIIDHLVGRSLMEDWSAIKKRIDDRSNFQDLELEPTSRNLLYTAINQLGFGYMRARKTLEIAREIANLSKSIKIEAPHLAEAIQYRRQLPRLNYHD